MALTVTQLIEKLQRYENPADVFVFVKGGKLGDWRPVVTVLGLYNESTQWVAIEVGDEEEAL
jgi:hypothetical protein